MLLIFMTFGIMISAKLSISGKVNENILKNGDSGENQRGVGLTIDSNAQDKKTLKTKMRSKEFQYQAGTL